MADHLHADPEHPDGLAFDTALITGVAHPLVWCAAGAEAARRAGIGLGIVAADGGYFALAHPQEDQAIVLDPVESAVIDAHGLGLGDLRWRCAHQLAHLLLGLIARRAAVAGRHDVATRAMEIALGLPLAREAG